MKIENNVMKDSIHASIQYIGDSIAISEINDLRSGKYYYPKVKLLTKIKSEILYYIKKNDPLPNYKFFWPNAIRLEGLIDWLNVSNNELIFKEIEKYGNELCSYLDKRGVYYGDESSLGNILIFLFSKTRNDKYLEKAAMYAEHLKGISTGNKYELIPYRKTNPTICLIDTLGLSCPFLLNYAFATGDRDLIEVVENQFSAFFANGIDKENSIPYHGYDMNTAKKIGELGWGRGVGWLMYGLAKCIRHIEDNGKYKFGFYYKMLVMLSESVNKFQNNDGYFPWKLSALPEHIDTSATALIGFGNSVIFKHDTSRVSSRVVVEKSVAAISKSMAGDNKIYDCSSECEGPGLPPKKFDTYPWCSGPALSMLAAAKGLSFD